MPSATTLGLRSSVHEIEVLHEQLIRISAPVSFIWRLGDPAVEGYFAASRFAPRRQAAGY